ncbi:MAG: hypothetical protein IKV71_08190, partial [Psychrobacter sp.]|nr:hypothetical protein [Psychrobacter sp.]
KLVIYFYITLVLKKEVLKKEVLKKISTLKKQIFKKIDLKSIVAKLRLCFLLRKVKVLCSSVYPCSQISACLVVTQSKPHSFYIFTYSLQ